MGFRTLQHLRWYHVVPSDSWSRPTREAEISSVGTPVRRGPHCVLRQYLLILAVTPSSKAWCRSYNAGFKSQLYLWQVVRPRARERMSPSLLVAAHRGCRWVRLPCLRWCWDSALNHWQRRPDWREHPRRLRPCCRGTPRAGGSGVQPPGRSVGDSGPAWPSGLGGVEVQLGLLALLLQSQCFRVPSPPRSFSSSVESKCEMRRKRSLCHRCFSCCGRKTT